MVRSGAAIVDSLRMASAPVLKDARDQESARALPVGWLLGAAAVFIGVFSTWGSGGGVTLNGVQGPHNGWFALVFLGVLAAGFRSARSLRWPGMLVVTLSGFAAMNATLGGTGVPGLSIGWGYWLTAFGGLTIVGVSVGAIWLRLADRGLSLNNRHDPKIKRSVLAVAGALLLFGVFSRIVSVQEDPSWPPPPSAVTAETALDAVDSFDGGPRDVGLDFAWSSAATVEPFVDGVNFFPQILSDIEAAESSVHILMFGWKAGDVGTEFAAVLEQKLADGVEVRIIVDAIGSAAFTGSGDMFSRLADSGAEIVVNDTAPIDGDGLYQDRSLSWAQSEVGRADHRKLYVIDGVTAWTGGAGIEDHFRNGEFHDVMVRVTGDVVRQTQAAFLTSFQSHGATLPDDLSAYFPAPASAGDMPTALVQVVPGGFASATQATRELIDSAELRLDIMNPYLTDRDMIERIINASERGVDVRVILSEESNNFMAATATQHRFGDLLEAGVEVWEFPGAVVHAKLIVSDDTVQFGTLNLDAWALYRDFEIALITEDADTADAFVATVFEPDIERSQLAEASSGASVVLGWLADKIAYFL